MDAILIKILVLVFSIVVHEVAHGWAALRLGDDTAKEMGRLTLNPISHIDIMGSLVVPGLLAASGTGLMFGWAKPVPVDTRRLNDPWNDHPKVAAAGPASNLLLALAFAVLHGVTAALLRSSGGAGGVGADLNFFLYQVATMGILINVILAIFNLLPIPPLDGSWILRRFLPGHMLRSYDNLRRYGFMMFVGIVVLLNYTPFGGVLMRIMQVVLVPYQGISTTIQKIFT